MVWMLVCCYLDPTSVLIVGFTQSTLLLFAACWFAQLSSCHCSFVFSTYKVFFHLLIVFFLSCSSAILLRSYSRYLTFLSSLFCYFLLFQFSLITYSFRSLSFVLSDNLSFFLNFFLSFLILMSKDDVLFFYSNWKEKNTLQRCMYFPSQGFF